MGDVGVMDISRVWIICKPVPYELNTGTLFNMYKEFDDCA